MLEAQPLGQALSRLAQALDLQILIPPALVRGKTAPALNGRYDAEQGLHRLLEGSGLGYRATGRGVVTIFELQGGRTTAAAATPAPTARLTAITTSLAKMQVIGSRIPRSEVEGASPLVIISAEQIEQRGYQSLAEALVSDGAGNYGGESETSSGGFIANAKPLNLHGLGPGRALILVDGRRVPDYPFPFGGRSNFQSLGDIPLANVERIELMTGGASAIYGADAIAGVVNIVLKRRRSGSELRLRAGTSGQGGGDRVEMQWSRGHGGEDWGLDYSLQYSARELLHGFQRELQRPPGQGGVTQPEPGLAFWVGGPVQGRWALNVPEGTCERWGGEFVDWNYVLPASKVGLKGMGCGTWNNLGYRSLTDGGRTLSGQLHADWDVSPRLQLWMSTQFWLAHTELAGGMETIVGPHSATTGRVELLYDPEFGPIAPIRTLTPQEVGGIDRMNDHYRERMVDLAVGVRGQLGSRMDWAFTVDHSDYVVERDRRRLLGEKVNAFFFGPRLGTTSDGLPIHVLDLDHWYAPLTPDEYSALSTNVHYDARTRLDTASWVLSGSALDLPAGPLGAAVVLEASRQRYSLQAEPGVMPLQLDLYDLAGSTGHGVRDRYAAGAEVSIPLASTLQASLAGRLDKYDDPTALDLARTWRAGLEWRPRPGLLLRASHATSFKAPDMHWIYSDGGGSFGSALDAASCIAAGANPRCAGFTYEFLARSYRNPNLREETGVSTTAGFVWDVTPALSVTADFWDISNSGGIGRISIAQLLRDEAECVTGLRLDGSPTAHALTSPECRVARARVTRTGPDSSGRIVMVESGPANQSYRRLRGVDTVLDWHGAVGASEYTARLAWSHTFWARRRTYYSGGLDEAWREARDNLAFRSNLRADLGWQGQDGWSANLYGQRYGSLPRADGVGRIGPYLLWNANIGKRITARATVRLFINNLFDAAPPHDASNADFPYYYDQVYSAVGREFSAQLDYRFD